MPKQVVIGRTLFLPSPNQEYYTVNTHGLVVAKRNVYDKSDLFNIINALCHETRQDAERFKEGDLQVINQYIKTAREFFQAHAKEATDARKKDDSVLPVQQQ